MRDYLNRTKTIALVLVLVLAFAIRIAPMLLDAIVEPDQYFHLRMSKQLVSEQQLPEHDALSMQGRHYTYAPLFHTIFGTLAIFTSIELELLIPLLPSLYGVATALIAFVFARRLFGENAGIYAALALAVEPMHIIRTASYARPDGLALLLVPAIIYLVYTQRYRVAALLSIAQVLLHPLSTLYLLLLLVLWAVACKIWKHRMEAVHARKIAIIILLTFAVFGIWLLSLPYPASLYVSNVSFQSSEMGLMTIAGLFSFFTFSWLFVVFGLWVLQRQFFLKLWLLYSFLYATIGLRLGIFMAMPMAITAGFGIRELWARTRRYSIVFLLLVAMLALLTVLPRLSTQSPFATPQDKAAMLWLGINTDENATIASTWDRGHPLTYYAKRKVVMDGYFEFAPGIEARNNALWTIAQSSDCEKIRENAERYSADYFFIAEAMLKWESFKNGIMEADECPYVSSAFQSDGARIMKFG